MRKKRKKMVIKIIYYCFTKPFSHLSNVKHLSVAWDKLTKQMDKMNLSPTEKDLIKQEI